MQAIDSHRKKADDREVISPYTAAIVPAEFSETTLDILWRDLERGDWGGAAVEFTVLAVCVGGVRMDSNWLLSRLGKERPTLVVAAPVNLRLE